MPSMFGGDQCDKDYAPHMWLGDHFIHDSEKVIEVGEWWYRAGKCDDESIVAERWKGGMFPYEGQTDHEFLTEDEIPEELYDLLKPVSRAEQAAFQAKMEKS